MIVEVPFGGELWPVPFCCDEFSTGGTTVTIPVGGPGTITVPVAGVYRFSATINYVSGSDDITAINAYVVIYDNLGNVIRNAGRAQSDASMDSLVVVGSTPIPAEGVIQVEILNESTDFLNPIFLEGDSHCEVALESEFVEQDTCATDWPTPTFSWSYRVQTPDPVGGIGAARSLGAAVGEIEQTFLAFYVDPQGAGTATPDAGGECRLSLKMVDPGDPLTETTLATYDLVTNDPGGYGTIMDPTFIGYFPTELFVELTADASWEGSPIDITAVFSGPGTDVIDSWI
jgi:hypothetical protein